MGEQHFVVGRFKFLSGWSECSSGGSALLLESIARNSKFCGTPDFTIMGPIAQDLAGVCASVHNLKPDCQFADLIEVCLDQFARCASYERNQCKETRDHITQNFGFIF